MRDPGNEVEINLLVVVNLAPHNDTIERLNTTFNGKRLLAVDSLYFSSNQINPSEKSKITQTHVHDKRETTNFDVEMTNTDGKSGFLPFAGKNTETRYLISL